MHPRRTTFAGEIVTEYFPPVRHAKRGVILLPGLPTVPKKDALLHWFREQNWWVFFPRYRGTWESSGMLFENEPTRDVSDVISGIHHGFVDAWSGERVRPDISKMYVIGSSFGGTAALLAAADERVQHAIALSPVVDWRAQEGTHEPIEKLADFVRVGFNEAYRVQADGWEKIQDGEMYNPVSVASSLPGEKICMIHSRDDMVVPYDHASSFAEQIDAPLISLYKQGHLSLSDISNRTIKTHIENILYSQRSV